MLYLLNPSGRRYVITTFALSPVRPGDSGHTPSLVDWSGDGRRALFWDEFAVGADAAVIEVDLATGAKRTVMAAPCCGSGVAYSRPAGRAIVVKDVDTSSGKYTTYRSTLERVDLTGTRQLTYPTDHLGVAGTYDGRYLETLDGTQLVLGTDNGMVVVGNDGAVARQLPMPGPRSACGPVRWWASTVILAACDSPHTPSADQDPDQGTQLWKVPLAGGAPSALTPADGQGLGYRDGWQLPSGTFLQDVPGCGGDGMLFRLTTAMQTQQVTVPGVDSKNSVFGIGVTPDGEKLVLAADTGCGSHSRSLLIYDPATNTSNVLLDGGVKRVILYPAP